MSKLKTQKKKASFTILLLFLKLLRTEYLNFKDCMNDLKEREKKETSVEQKVLSN